MHIKRNQKRDNKDCQFIIINEKTNTDRLKNLITKNKSLGGRIFNSQAKHVDNQIDQIAIRNLQL